MLCHLHATSFESCEGRGGKQREVTGMRVVVTRLEAAAVTTRRAAGARRPAVGAARATREVEAMVSCMTIL